MLMKSECIGYADISDCIRHVDILSCIELAAILDYIRHADVIMRQSTCLYIRLFWKCCYIIQQTFCGSNTNGSFTMAVSSSFLSPLEKMPYSCRCRII